MNAKITLTTTAMLTVFATLSMGGPLLEDYDFGDAPDQALGTAPGDYQTLQADSGPSHFIIPGAPYFDDGTQTDFPDPEQDGQPTIPADGDDINGMSPDDEDGCSVALLIIGQSGSASIGVDDGAGGTGSGGGYVDAWIDFNQNGSFLEPNELIYSGWLGQGMNAVNVNVPLGAMPGQTYARFRINSIAAGLPPTGGPAQDGEVEDHTAFIDEGLPQEDFDLGDAPDQPYPTLLANNGAFHLIVLQAPYFDDGSQTDQPDPENDGQPTATADGDDNNGFSPDDEDGIIFTAPLIAGMNGSVTITVDDGKGGAGAGQAWVDAWIDFNGNGSWLDIGEHIHSGMLPQGANVLPVAVPASALAGMTYARFRIHSGSLALAPTGFAADGEVEDHIVDIEEELMEEFDWGDAPDALQAVPSYRTLAANNGANHLIVAGVFMGTLIDSETDGQPTPAADGDDILDGNDDEDGVVFKSLLIPGQQAQFDVTVSVSGWLDIWLDADNSGDWTGPNDLIFSGTVASGLNPLSIALPQGIAGGQNYMRFRFNTGTALPFNGGAPDGEVEDYAVHIESLDWSDAPVGFNTLAAYNGAHHTIAAGVSMGPLIDAELDGQPTPPANGDDLTTSADEDGVAFLSPIVPGQQAQFGVTVSAVGWVDVWLDIDLSGSWTAPDYLWGGAVAVGANTITIPVPYQTLQGQSYMRFRYNTAGAPLPPTGWGADGEVEDYQVIIEEPELDFGDAPDGPYPTLQGNNGAFHIIATGVMLGGAIDAEPNGQPSGGADGDDANGIDDEDGVAFIGKIVAGSNGTINVTAGTAGGKLDAWIDFGADGSWIGDHLWGGTSKTLTAGPNALLFTVPQPSALGPTFARFRISSVGGLPPDNFGIPTPDGEVEDYTVDLYQPVPSPTLEITNLFFTASNTVATIEWNTQASILYQLQATTNLVISNSWTDVEIPVMGPINWQTNNISLETNKFYRVTAPWTP